MEAETQKQIFIKDLKDRDTVRSTFLVKSKNLNRARNAKPYLALILADKSGDIDTRVWEQADQLTETFSEGDVVAISGKVHFFQERLQLVVQHLVAVPSEEVDLADYLPACDQDTEALYQDLLRIFDGAKNPHVREVALSLLNDPEIARRYKVCPAAKTVHHAFLGGLLVHTMSLIRLAEAVLPNYENIDRDLVLFGAAFHDFGKIFELSYDREIGYTDEGKLVGHISIGVNLLDRAIQKIPEFPKLLEYHLKHLILSHHGRLDYGSPKRPATIEAILVSQLDDLDSKIQSIQTHMKSERNQSRWTAHHRAYDQYYMKSDVYLNPDAK